MILMDLLAVQWQSLQREVAANIRLRWGSGLISFLALFYLALVLSDIKLSLHQEHQRLAEQRSELAEMAPESDWLQRLKHEEQQQQKLKRILWQARTDGLAQASIQSELTRISAQAGLTNFDIRMGTPQIHSALSGIKKVNVQLKGVYTGDQILDFVQLIEGNDIVLSFERLYLRTGKRGSVIDALVVAYIDVSGST